MHACVHEARQGAYKYEAAHGRGTAAKQAMLPHVTCKRATELTYKCHLCGWIERIPGGTQENDGVETGLWGITAATLAWVPFCTREGTRG